LRGVAVQGPLIIVGGHCSVQGFDAEGSEMYWTVTSDNVSALAFADTNSDGHMELIVGSDDFEIRVYRDDDVLDEITETEKVVALCSMGKVPCVHLRPCRRTHSPTPSFT
jgi:Bardet-Biedl syndrome 2 protein